MLDVAARISTVGVYVWVAVGVITLLLIYLVMRYIQLKFASPNPNSLPARARRMIGRRGAALRDSEQGLSRIQLDSIEWPIRLEENARVKQGDILEVMGFDGTTLVTKILTV